MMILTFLIVIETVDMADGRNELLRRKGVFSSSFCLDSDGSIVNTGRSFEPQAPYIMESAKQAMWKLSSRHFKFKPNQQD